MADSAVPARSPGWYVWQLVSTLSFEDGGAWLTERWSIVAEATLDELRVELNLDGGAPVARRDRGVRAVADEVVVDVLGAEITTDRSVSSTGRPVVGILLPGPLVAGDRHDFELSVSATQFEQIRRHVHVPAVACRRLEVRVRFSRPGAPAAVTRIWNEWSAGAADPLLVLPVDRCGEVATSFQDLKLGAEYGISWLAGQAPV